MSVTIRPYRGADEAALLRLWNVSLTHDPVLRAHALMAGGASKFRYLDYYDALGTTCGCLGSFRKAAALMAPPGAWVQRKAYLLALLPP